MMDPRLLSALVFLGCIAGFKALSEFIKRDIPDPDNDHE